MLCMMYDDDMTTWRLLVSTKRYIRCCSLFTRPRQQTNGVSRCDLDESRIQYWNSSWTKRDRQGRMIGLIGDYNITVQPYNSCADRCADHGIVTVERRAVHWKVRWTQSFNVDYLPTYLPLFDETMTAVFIWWLDPTIGIHIGIIMKASTHQGSRSLRELPCLQNSELGSLVEVHIHCRILHHKTDTSSCVTVRPSRR